MIEKEEIDHKSEELGVHVSNVQRDYVFGWLLAGLFDPGNPLQRVLILKGGNAFRKAYFEHARFSNDLDFSTQVELDEGVLRDSIQQACGFAHERSGIEFLVDDTRIGERKIAEEDSRMYQARVYFKSFYGEEDITLKVKLDIKEYDRIFLPVQTRRLIHAYSDSTHCQAELRSLKMEELLASKLKALLQRRHSPDLYDFVYSVFFQRALDIRRREVITTFLKKTIYEGNPHLARNLLLELPFQILRGFWNEYLVCPKPSLVTFDDAEASFRIVVAELFALLEPQPAFAGVASGGGFSHFGSAYRDVIMEAGRLQRILRLVYGGIERRVEPYALAFKRRKDGVAREYFYAWDLSGGQSGQLGIKSFTSDKVQSIDMTEQSFEPRFPMELAKAGGYFSTPNFATQTFRTSTHTRSKGTSSFGMSYTVECPYCGKTFKRNKLDTRLNEHKDHYGNRCYGRVGTIV